MTAEAFKLFFFRNYSPFFSFADSLLKNNLSSRNVVSEAMFMLWDMHTGSKDEIVDRSFLYGTIRRNCLNYLKYLSHHPVQHNAHTRSRPTDPGHQIPSGIYRSVYQTQHSLPEDILRELSLFMNRFDVNC